MRAFQLYPTEESARMSLLSHAELIKSATKEAQLLPDSIQLNATKRDGDSSLQLQDVAFIDHWRSLVVFSEALCDELKKEKDVVTQWVPIDVDGESYFLMNIVELLDAIDPSKSTIEYGKGSSIVKADELVFHEDTVSTHWLFRDRITASKACTCIDEFHSWFNKNGFTGLKFLPVYDSNHAPFKLGPGTKDALSRPDVYGPDGFFPGYEHLWSEKIEPVKNKVAKPSLPDEVTVEVVPFGNDRVEKVASRLAMYGITSDSPLNQITLPLNEKSPGAKEKTPYSLTEKQAYFDFINDVFMHAAGPDSAQAALEFIKHELLHGRRDFGIDYDLNSGK